MHVTSMPTIHETGDWITVAQQTPHPEMMGLALGVNSVYWHIPKGLLYMHCYESCLYKLQTCGKVCAVKHWLYTTYFSLRIMFYKCVITFS